MQYFASFLAGGGVNEVGGSIGCGEVARGERCLFSWKFNVIRSIVLIEAALVTHSSPIF